MTVRRIAICTAQVPFVWGGAEIHVEGLRRELSARGYRVDVIRLPFKWYPKPEILKSCLAWRLLDLTEADGERIDLVIPTKFPSYVVQHPNKVTWLIHQYRSVYDLFGTPYSDFTSTPEDQRLREIIRRIDTLTLGESKCIFSNAANTAGRLARFNGLHAEPLYHPPQYEGRYRCDEYGDFVLAVGRLNKLKRFELLVEAMAHVQTPLQAVIVGEGPEREPLARLARQRGVADRITFLGFADEQRLIELYARCLCVLYGPYDEDFGYVTLEAFRSRKPVLTARDSGGPLEFVTQGETGFIADPQQPRQFAAYMDELYADRLRAQAIGEAGFERIAGITWDHVIARLVGG